MRAMLLSKPAPIEGRPLETTDLPRPALPPGTLLLRVTACGVCRTDLQICEGDLAARKLPIVPGHQIVGHVVALGEGAENWKIGDRAGAGWLASACGTCARCREGRENLCADARFTGWDVDGGYASDVVVRADFAFRIPEVFDDLSAAPLLCGGVIGYRSLKLSGAKSGQRLGLFGFGASALLTMQIAIHQGVRVYVFTRSESERARAKSLGAEWTGGYDGSAPARLDAAITFAPAGRVVVAALAALDRGGTVAINAIHLDGIPAFDYGALWWERSLRSVANYTREDAREFLELAGRIPIKTTFDVYPLEEANAALESVRSGRVRGAAVLTIPE